MLSGACFMTLKINHLHKRFGARPGKNGTSPLQGISFSLNSGETIAVSGPSGSGKTTLALILCGLMKPDAGEVALNDLSIWPPAKNRRKEIHRRIQIVWQHPETAFNPRWKVIKSLREPFKIHGRNCAPDQIGLMLEQVDLAPPILERRPDQLSGGELQRLAIARAMSLEPDVLILDEPTSMLDAVTQAQVINLLRKLQEKTGVAYLFISHDLELARVFSHRMFLLEGGKLHPLTGD